MSTLMGTIGPKLLLSVAILSGTAIGGCGEHSENRREPSSVTAHGDAGAGGSSDNWATTLQQPVFEAIDVNGEAVPSDQPPFSFTDQGGERSPPKGDADASLAQIDTPRQQPEQPATAETPTGDDTAAGRNSPGKSPAPNEKPGPKLRRSIPRQIIYTATLTLVVNDLSEAEAKIRSLVEQAGGYVSSNSVTSRTGQSRGGQWVVRVPVPAYDRFLADLGNVGVPEDLQQKAQDVTQEFIDLDARIRNQKRLEARLLELLEKRDGELKEVIEVERELARVRSEIEQMEGRLRYLRSQVSDTTVTINVREEKGYTPPQAPTFGQRIYNVWGRSLTALKEFGQGAVILFVALAPWTIFMIPAVAFFRWLLRRKPRTAPPAG